MRISHDEALGLCLIAVGGVCCGLYTTPMKWCATDRPIAFTLPGRPPTRGRRRMSWKWENIWLVYALWGMLLLPWVLNLATVHHLGEVYGRTDFEVRAVLAPFAQEQVSLWLDCGAGGGGGISNAGWARMCDCAVVPAGRTSRWSRSSARAGASAA
jgi:hypothetical protein